ncbi:disulfide-isomerase, partial [Coemansia nantahalensis]
MRLANLLWAALAAFGARAGADAAAPQEAAEPIPASRHVIELDRAAYLDLLRTHDTILLEFYAHWCPACRRLAPTLDAVAEAAHASHPHIAVARADASAVEYLSTSFMVDVLPGLAFLHRPGADAVHSVRRVSADFTAGALLDYIGGGWAADEPVGGIATLWCTPTNLCGHLGGLLGELVVDIDRRLNPSGIPPWAFMAVVVSAVY